MNYEKASLAARENFASKVTKGLNKNVSDDGMRFLKLTTLVPNWETYLTEKQKESAVRYVKNLNASEVDYQLKLNVGVTNNRIFGGSTYRGAIGRLEDAYENLKKAGYYDKPVQKESKKTNISDKTLSNVKELISLIIDHQDYSKYLTSAQAKKVESFLRHRSFVKASKELGISPKSLQQSLIGSKGALVKLRKIHNDKLVSSWEEI